MNKPKIRRILFCHRFHREFPTRPRLCRGVHARLQSQVVLLHTVELSPPAEAAEVVMGRPSLWLGEVNLSLKLEEILYCSDFTPEAAAPAPYAMLRGKTFDVPVDICQLAMTPASLQWSDL
jgi:hypothetical protein